MSADREWPPDGETEGEEVEGSAYGDAEPYPGDDLRAAPAPGSGGQSDRKKPERSEQDRWRRFGWVALIILTAGVAWALILSTILINRSGDHTAQLLSLYADSQDARDQALRQIPKNQEERRAALEAQRQRTRTLQAAAEESRARAQASRAGIGRPSSGLQPALDRQLAFDRQLALNPQVAVNRQQALNRQLNRQLAVNQQLLLNRQQTDLLKQFRAAMRALREAIKDLRPRPSRTSPRQKHGSAPTAP